MERSPKSKAKTPLLHLSWDSPDNPWCGGGGAMRDWRILEGLQDWQRTVWTGRHPRGSHAPQESLRQDLGIGRFGEFVSRRTWGIVASRRIASVIKADGATLLSHSVSPWSPVPASLAYLDRTLIVLHHVAGEELLHRLGPLGPSALRYENRVVREGRFFSLSNRATAARIREVNPGARIELIPIGFDPPDFAPPTDRSEKSTITIAFLGRMDHRMKGLDRLFEAFGKLASRNDAFRLVVAGRSDRSMDAWMSAALSTHPARSKIKVVKNPTDQDKYRILDDADIFCVPSRFEGWCIAAVEAQSRGLPVVATCTDGLQDSVSDGHTGVLVPNDETLAAQALADAIEGLAADPQRRSRMGRAAIEWAGRFSWQAATRATHAFLDEIRQRRS